jgi:hypothetical protein
MGMILWNGAAAEKAPASSGVKNARFLTQQEARAILKADADGYVRNMTQADLRARGMDTRTKYLEVAAKAASDFSPAEQRRVRALCRLIDTRLRKNAEAPAPVRDDDDAGSDDDYDDEAISVNQAREAMFIEGFSSPLDEHDMLTQTPTHKPTSKPKAPESKWKIDADALAELPWVFAKIEGTAYEDGLPHTRAPNVIFLASGTLRSKNASLKRTLLHEKIHVYQRAYPEKTAALVRDAGYVNTGKRRNTVPLARANPDLDEWIYEDEAAKPMISVYQNDGPASVSDVHGAPQHEHPYEAMAWDVASRMW